MSRHVDLNRDALDYIRVDHGRWYSCEECFAHQDASVDEFLITDGVLEPEFAIHLRGCPACREETRAMVELIADEDGRDVPGLLEKFDRSVDLP